MVASLITFARRRLSQRLRAVLNVEWLGGSLIVSAGLWISGRPFLRSSTAFTTVRVPYCSPDGSAHSSVDGLPNRATECPLLPLVEAFYTDGIRYCLPDCSLDRLFFRSSMAFPMVRVPYCVTDGSTDGSADHSLLPLVDCFRSGKLVGSLVGLLVEFP